MEAVVLAGGFGKRLRSVVADVPKPMAPICGRPFLAYLVTYLGRQGFRRVVLAVGYKHEVIERWFGPRFAGIDLAYAVESTPLGTGGAIREAMRLVNSDNAVVMNGDSFVEIDLRRFPQFHIDGGYDFTIATRQVCDTGRYGAVVADGGRVVSFLEKTHQRSGFINAGVYVVRQGVFERFDLPSHFSVETEFLQMYVSELRLGAFEVHGNFLDIGTPEDYAKAQVFLPEWMGRRHR